MKTSYLTIIFLILSVSIFPQEIKVIESNESFIKFSIKFDSNYQIKDTVVNNFKFQKIHTKQIALRKQGEPEIPSYNVSLAVPYNTQITVRIIDDVIEKYNNMFIIPFIDVDSISENKEGILFNKSIYNANKYFPQNVADANTPFIFRYARIADITINPFQFNPVAKELVFHKSIIVRVDYNKTSVAGKTYQPVKDAISEEYIKTNAINYLTASKWIMKESKALLIKTTEQKSWYNPGKNYFKIYVKTKGIYRITYEKLRELGLPSGEISSSKLELFSAGEKVPIEMKDGNDNIFNAGDYIQFVGFPPVSSPYCKQNIYNNDNVYWLSYESDSSGYRYTFKDGYPGNWNWDTTIQSSYQTLHYEVDSLYERLGLAPNGNRDHWFWGKASGQNGVNSEVFTASFPVPKGFDEKSTYYTFRLNMHGMTNNNVISPDHRVHIYLTSQSVGEKTWDGQNEAEFESTIKVGTIGLFNTNNLQVVVKGDITPDIYGNTSDEIRINWFELDYLREHRADSNYFNFTSTQGLAGKYRFDVYSWKANSMTILIPQKGTAINNPLVTNNIYKEVLFVDSIKGKTEYFCYSGDVFLNPDSISRCTISNLISSSNGADYIIITHSKFKKAAEKLANYRSSHLKGFSSPRIKIIDVDEIYNEFSSGLLNPYAVKDFIKYAFENWTQPAPSYICLLGDMSWDYRGKLSSSRKNYVPSIPYQQTTYGEAVSDNMFVAVSGDDVIPDLAIGRLSCETTDEADILVDKIINYPGDNSKEWKQRMLLIGAGENLNDESYFGFNNACVKLEDTYLNPNGFIAKKIFRYPGRTDYEQYKGDRPEIREAINEGCAITNFYGHGGGYQWDMVFLNDDIYLLQNEKRLPMVFSVTCYTAHFDNQDVFGEQFNKAPDKGCIGFWGNTGLTIWIYGLDMNIKLFDQIFSKQHYVIGDALLYSKTNYTSISQYQKDHIALLTLLGDPALELALPDKPDFSINSNSILIKPAYPVIKDTSYITVRINNLGKTFPNDSVFVQLTATYLDTSFIVGSKKLGSFGEKDSVSFKWIPAKPGLVTFKAEVNLSNKIDEVDYSDNTASNSFMIYNMNEPSVIKPINGFNTSDNSIKFLFADIGYYISKSLLYYIEIDTSMSFSRPIITSSSISASNGFAEWASPKLKEGNYFWRAKMLDNQQYSKWTDIYTFSITNNPKDGYYAKENQLKLFTMNNVLYSDVNKSLQLNTSILPPRPSNLKFISDMRVSLPDSISGLSAITTDGTYIYFGAMAYYDGKSKIYKLGTGYNSTIEGKYYGPVSDKSFKIWHQIFYHSDGYLYIPEGDAHSLVKMNPTTGDTTHIMIPDGLLNATNSKIQNGGFYLTSDGNYVYNIAYKDSVGENKYSVRILDPANGWKKVKDIKLSGESYTGFCSFFVYQNYLYPYENYMSGFLRDIDITTGEFKDEWLSNSPYQGYYAWCYDWNNDKVYASVFHSGYVPKISKFVGSYKQANGSIVSQEVGPASVWKKVNYSVDVSSSSGSYNSSILGFNTKTKIWDTLYSKVPTELKLDSVDAEKYTKLKMHVSLIDSSFGSSEPIKFKSLNLQYVGLPEVSLSTNDITVSPDSNLQGIPVNIKCKVRNMGYSSADNIKINLYMDDADSAFYTHTLSIPMDSIKEITNNISTNNIVLNHKITAKAISQKSEFYSFNNIAKKNIYIARDSIKPVFSIRFDGEEILDGDIVSAKPQIVMTLKDNSPLPLSDTSRFYIFHNGQQLYFRNDSLKFSYTTYPNSQATVNWNPFLKSGKHVLEILAKDASGNYFDTTSYSISFSVNDKNDIIDVYNYPNPFKDDTYFTFNLTGQELPEEFRIRIFTVAGRLIKEISVPSSQLRFGLNKIYWDGKDEDKNGLANGVYFYKFVVRNNNISKTVIQKMAKVK